MSSANGNAHARMFRSSVLSQAWVSLSFTIDVLFETLSIYSHLFVSYCKTLASAKL